MTVQVSLVPEERILEVWPKVAQYMRGAVKYTRGRYETSDVLDLLLYMHYPLWIAFEDDKILGAVTTRFIEYPHKKFLFMEFCGGVGLRKWKTPMLDVLRKWAADNNCDGIECAGRVGWKKVFESDGYVLTAHAFEVDM